LQSSFATLTALLIDVLDLHVVHHPDQANVLELCVAIRDSYHPQVRINLRELDGLRAYLTPQTTSAQKTESIVVFDAVVSERWLCEKRWVVLTGVFVYDPEQVL
jgi:hypothetical protein